MVTLGGTYRGFIFSHLGLALLPSETLVHLCVPTYRRVNKSNILSLFLVINNLNQIKERATAASIFSSWTLCCCRRTAPSIASPWPRWWWTSCCTWWRPSTPCGTSFRTRSIWTSWWRSSASRTSWRTESERFKLKF